MGTGIIIPSAFFLEGAFYGALLFPNLKVAYIFILAKKTPTIILLIAQDLQEGFKNTEPKPVS